MEYLRSITVRYLSSQHLTSVSCCLDTSATLLWPGLRVKTRAPGWWRLVVAGLGDSSGGCSFTTHCAAGLSLDAEVVPLAAGEMSCLLPFPYTPKPNEQHGARPLALAPSSLRSVSSFNGLLSFSTSSILCAAVYLIFVILTPSIPQTIHLPFFCLCTQSQRSPLCGLTTQRLAANDLAWPQRLGSALSLSHGIYTQTNKQMGAPQRHVHASHTATYARGYTVCQYTPTHADTHSFSYAVDSGLTDLQFLTVTVSYFQKLPPAANVIVEFEVSSH